MEEQECVYCELVNVYVDKVLVSKSKEELFDILHELVVTIQDVANLELFNEQINLLIQARNEITKTYE